MGYTVRLVLATPGDRFADRRIRLAIRKAGGTVQEVEHQITPGGVDEVVTVQVNETQTLSRVLHSVEEVDRVAVREVQGADPREG
ncbi:MAG: hypothetical protein HYY16_19745 [Planctomycetes bacterium]|nr:hypothetical protein [Planctomycetota bacterium]